MQSISDGFEILFQDLIRIKVKLYTKFELCEIIEKANDSYQMVYDQYPKCRFLMEKIKFSNDQFLGS